MPLSGSDDPRDVNDPRRAAGSAPSSATGMFSAVGAPMAAEVSEEDFFAQFRSVPVGTPAAVPEVVPEAPVQAGVGAAASGAVSGSGVVRPVVPQVREVFIKPGQGRAPVAVAPVVAAAVPSVAKKRPGEVTSFLMAMGAVEEAPVPVKPEPVKLEPVLEAPRVEDAPVERAAAEVVVPVAAPAVVAAGGFTQMFQVPEPAPVEGVAEAAPVGSSAELPITAVEVEEQKIAAAPVTGQVEKPSFTQLLKAITDQRPVVEAQAASPAAVAPVVVPEPVKVANINEILERLNRTRNTAPPPPPPIAPAPESVAAKLQAFRASVAATPEVKPVEPPAAAKAEPGSFTQFMAGVAPREVVAPVAGLTPPQPVEVAPQAGGGPGSFTQMMASLGSAAPAAAVPPPAPQAVAPAPQVAGMPPLAVVPPVAPVARPGSMTQLLQSLDKPREGGSASGASPSAPAGPLNPPAAKDGSGFTQFFQSPLASPRREAERSPFEAAGGGGAPAMQGGGSFTQMMQALNQPQAGGAPKDASFGGPPPLSGPPEPLFPASGAGASFPGPAPGGGMGGPGSFTQLMQTLDGPATAAAPPRPVAAAPVNVGAPGGATSIFAAPSAAAPVAASPAGPSEYTQIISGSALRDARAKAPGMPAQPPAPIVPGAMQMPGFAMPGAPPPPPMPPMAMPQMQMPGMAMPQMAPPAVPAPPPAPPKTKLQQYLPLIIIANVLLVIVIVVIVIFVLRAHK